MRGLAAFPTLARVAHALRCTPRELDERCTVDDVLDMADLAHYLAAVDICAMPAPPKPAPSRGGR